MTTLRLDIGGPKGNAFYILGLVETLGRAMGMDPDARKLLRSQMTGEVWQALGGQGTDYNHLVRTFSDAFPSVEIYASHKLPMDSDLYTIDNRGSMEL